MISSGGRYNAGGAAAELLGRIAPDLPKDCLGLSIENRTVACYWMEKARVEEGTLEQIKIVLDVLKEDFCPAADPIARKSVKCK